MSGILRDALLILAGFVLGMLVMLAVVVGTDGVYEYRVIPASDLEDMVNNQHWEIIQETDIPGGYYLRRKRVRLP